MYIKVCAHVSLSEDICLAIRLPEWDTRDDVSAFDALLFCLVRQDRALGVHLGIGSDSACARWTLIKYPLN